MWLDILKQKKGKTENPYIYMLQWSMLLLKFQTLNGIETIFLFFFFSRFYVIEIFYKIEI